jgi:hypothetical protein
MKLHKHDSGDILEGGDISEIDNGKGKDKVHPRTGHEGPEGGEYMYSCIVSLTSALNGVGGQCHDPAALPPGKTRYSL